MGMIKDVDEDMSLEAMRTAFDSADADRNGYIGFEEFVAVIMYDLSGEGEAHCGARDKEEDMPADPRNDKLFSGQCGHWCCIPAAFCLRPLGYMQHCATRSCKAVGTTR